MIVEAAIKKDGVIYRGRRHSDIIFANLNVSLKGGIQGFVNDKGEFKNRQDSYKEALECNQIRYKTHNKEYLISEDIY